MDIRKLIEAYHKAWTCGDFAAARSFLADDLDFRGSIDCFSNADDFLAALKQFARMTSHVTMLKSFYDNDGAALLYDCETPAPAGVIRTAEFFTVSGNRIKAIRLVFDATDLRKAMQA
ncbi:nuclear transport factor 2 family protein [Chlorobium ferrooxidans]|uniref:SnoaL-like domain-containing protein n=1 Tax=Chlorobium ferrooxidans DSM 13031 TaxID=377431 RepID=Q0YRN6_9CHLB|nr:nuclear transport factor 2 family protein [Chlorobium ferrooxidans]EAT58976.1 hypothetical protein CferDRAFT_0950 [Chlorobium ferrooxidans DSM 13031]